MRYSIGIDIGTTTVKCILFGEGPVVVAESTKEYATILGKASCVEQDPNVWWQGTVECIRRIIKGIDPSMIRVISVSSQAPCVLPVDREGNPLCNALIWMDRRSEEEVAALKENIGMRKIFEITGNRLDSYFALSELMWIVRNRPELMSKCYKIMQVNAFINLKLTGVFSADHSSASLTEIYDINKKCWSSELLNIIGADPSWMPDVYDSCSPIGHVSAKASSLTGLSETTEVLAGTVDAVAAGLEIGLYKNCNAAEMTGTSSVVMVGFDKMITVEKLSYLTGRKPDSSILFGAMNSAGGSLKWFRDSLFGGETPGNDAYNRMNKEVEQGAMSPTGMIFLPYLSGERAPIWDSKARGSMIGINMQTSRAEFIRAIMEGSCYALMSNLKRMMEAGIPIKSFMCCGGCSKSDIWLKIKASVINRQIQIPELNLGAPGGLSFINAAYMGEYSTPEEASEACFRVKKVVDPVPEWIAPYQELYERFEESYAGLKKVYSELSDFRS